MRSTTSFSSAPVSAARSATISSSSPSGKNSCRGGSRRRIVTGRASMARKMPWKSWRWNGSRSASAASRSGVFPAMIMRRTVLMRSPVPLCSVGARPMPGAVVAGGGGVLGGVRVGQHLERRVSSTQDRLSEVTADSRRGELGGAADHLARGAVEAHPVALVQLHPPNSAPVLLVHHELRAPDTHVLPHPRATTAACDVMPPRASGYPRGVHPPTSGRRLDRAPKAALLALRVQILSVSVLGAICPTAAPGDAGAHADDVRGVRASSLNCGCNAGPRGWARRSGSPRRVR